MTTLTAATPSSGGLMTPQARGQAAGPSGMAFTDYLRVLRQRLVLIIILWLLFTAATVGFTAYMAKNHPTYTADALIEVRSVMPVNPLDPFGQQMRKEEMEELVQGQALLVVAPRVLTDTLKNAQVRNTSWFAWAEQQKDEAMEDLLEDVISVGAVRGTNYIRVVVSWRNPEDLPHIVNNLIETYLAYVNEMQQNEMRETQDQLNREINSAQTRLNRQNQDIETIRASGDMLGVVDNKPAPNERLLTLMALVTELEVETLGREAQWNALRNADPEQLPITADMQAIIAADPKITMLEGRVMTAQESYETARDRFGEEHKIVRNARSAMDRVESMLRQERSLKLVRLQAELVEQARRNWLEAQDQLLVLREKLQTAMAEQRDRDRKFAGYLRMMEEREMLKLQYEELLKQKDYLGLLLNQKQSVQISLRSQAKTPKRRSSPSWAIWVPGGSFMGLMLAAGLALLLDLADKSVRTPRDVARVPVLGLIPTADDDEVEIEQVETASLDAPHSIVAESFRNLRANLFFSAPAEQQGVLMITSPSGGNGKTTIATNLAISIALSGRRVLIVDCNFRRPALPRIFANTREEGLSNILIGQGRLDEYVTATHVPGLDVLTAGPTPPNPAELLGSSYLRDVIVDARSHYDQVIFDSPPVLLVSDAMVLAGAVDGVLVVCQYRSTSRGAMQRTQRQLEAINARLFGAILNLVETRAGGYFRKAYREFYEYSEPEEGDEASTPRRLQVAAGKADASDELDGKRHAGGEAKTSTTPPKPSTRVETVDTGDLDLDLDKDDDAGLDDVADLGDLDEVDEVDLGDRPSGDSLLKDDLDSEDFKINGDYDLGEGLEDDEDNDSPKKS